MGNFKSHGILALMAKNVCYNNHTGKQPDGRTRMTWEEIKALLAIALSILLMGIAGGIERGLITW